MNPDRLKLLKSLFESHPEDPFYAYALALEVADENPEEAILTLNLLKESHESYLPLYYQLAKLQIEVGMLENAKENILTGIAIALDQNEPKTKKELEALLLDLD